MDQLVPCDQKASSTLVGMITDQEKKSIDYVVRIFPTIISDLTRLLAEAATGNARKAQDPSLGIKEQLKPYFAFSSLLGKCPQISTLMYNYFESSSFQPIPKNLFKLVEQNVVYSYPGLNDELVKEILINFIKYLIFDRSWFSAIWNWSQLGKLISSHPSPDIRYLAACSLTLILQPTRSQHLSLVTHVCDGDIEALIDLQLKYRHIYENTFKLCVDTNARHLSSQFARHVGFNESGYSFCEDTFAKLTNVLLLKRHLNVSNSSTLTDQCAKVIENYVPVDNLTDTISKIAFSISINRPCLIRGAIGSGKTAVIDYIAAKTNRVQPPDYVKVQVSDQIDSKLLIGSYVSTEVPGQFEWQPGPLTKAMIEGSWILFEDIDTAPSEITQVIHSVIENGNLSCVSCCPIELNKPHAEFRILLTQKNRPGSTHNCFKFLEKSCDVVDLPQLSEQDIQDIINRRFNLPQLAPRLLILFDLVKMSLITISETRSVRLVNHRDLFKLCKRISLNGIGHKASNFGSKELDLIFLDAVGCLFGFLPSEDLLQLSKEVGSILNLAVNEVQRLTINRKPELTINERNISLGRVSLSLTSSSRPHSNIAYTKQSLTIMESIASCINLNEPVLLVGETGVGKTTMVQHIADLTGNKLVVLNLSQQSDSSDLIGGFKPVEMREIIRPLQSKFEILFKKTYDEESNKKFLEEVTNLFYSSTRASDWSIYLKVICKLSLRALGSELTKDRLSDWEKIHNKARGLADRIRSQDDSNPIALAFSDGPLLTAIKEGQWILLDEVNLAEPDVLQCLLHILDSIDKSDLNLQIPSLNHSIRVNPKFRIFACMNPSTDIGKRDLDQSVRARFTEFYVDEVKDRADLRLIVESYVKACFSPQQIERIVIFYQDIVSQAKLYSDISGNTPVYSLRTLCRALSMCSVNPCGSIDKSLFESIKVTFLHQLDEPSSILVHKLMQLVLFEKKSLSSLEITNLSPPKDGHQYICVEGFWLQKSNDSGVTDSKYIMTDTVHQNLKCLARVISISQRRLPILIQGNTSVGKTSLVVHLAKLTNNKCYRINNHEHTDLQEYVGRYVLKENGEIVFQEGLLVKAMRKGYWIILDELNLAPSELLEALNRVLDDNRELYIPETKELIKAHSKFILFATQNPPGEYAGRKFLSRAFRNRFAELHFPDLQTTELQTILQERCEMPPQYAKKIVSVMRELQMNRRESGCFNGKHGFMTMRDLLRWGERYLKFRTGFHSDKLFDWDQHLAVEGLLLLEGRVRTTEEAEVVKNVIAKIFKRKLDLDQIYNQEKFSTSKLSPKFRHIHFSSEFQRLFVRLKRALMYKEPVLLCGPTGCGKTTACQIFAELQSQNLITYNCHMGTESSDFIGSVRPSRDDETGRQTFPWVDGPLVESIKTGALFLMDEISLADDAVLERINSVLEPARSLTITERSGEEIFANVNFRFVATMNPGGDYGKKELSPALRNRFTEIYCQNTTNLKEIMSIITSSLTSRLISSEHSKNVLYIFEKFLQRYYGLEDRISIRDIVSLCEFFNKTTRNDKPRPLSIQEAIVNGASLVFFDQIGTCGFNSIGCDKDRKSKKEIKSFLHKLVEEKIGMVPIHLDSTTSKPFNPSHFVKFKKFLIKRGTYPIPKDISMEFVYDSPAVKRNLLKLARALQLDRPILLEGDPGVGKTSIVSALAKLTGNELVRINLSEQTDINDLFGSDLPDPNHSEGESPRFCWCDGPLLKAIKESKWILLDEMNLASQSVLEGLNSCLDHRGEIFVSELNKKFNCNRNNSRIFACQNPYNQGGSRKGLPQSFLNRFTSIYIKSHTEEDLSLILKKLYPQLPPDMLSKMITFNEQVSIKCKNMGKEFNLRNIIYWCDLMTKYLKNTDVELYSKPERFVQFAYIDSLRTASLRNEILEIFNQIFEVPVFEPPYREIKLGEYSITLCRSILPRHCRLSPQLMDLCILKYQLPYMESIAKAIEFHKMPIIVGESGVGKRSMIKILAGLTGNNLRIMGANQEMDTTELLGSFEQKNIQREIADLIRDSKHIVSLIVNSNTDKRTNIYWESIFENMWSNLYAYATTTSRFWRVEMIDGYKGQLLQLKDLNQNLKSLTTPHQEERLELILRRIDRLLSVFDSNSKPICLSGNFEWIDSILVSSIRDGSWLMIENANLMNPATLDRLNSLVEPDGSIVLNEKGSGPNGIEILRPHPNFRLILTVDPENGDLSRAMRNRGIEIFIHTTFFFEDFLMLLNQNGFEPEEKKACMAYCTMNTCCDVHKLITDQQPEENGTSLTYFGLNSIPVLIRHVGRGADIIEVLTSLLITHYQKQGFSANINEETIFQFVHDKMKLYAKTHQVKLHDERYKWMNFRHDLVQLTAGDADIPMGERDSKIFLEDINFEDILKSEERVDNIDIVNTCLQIKIFLELSTRGDFDYRIGLVKQTFSGITNLLEIVKKHMSLLSNERLPPINSLMPITDLINLAEMPIDTRNYPTIHEYLLCLDYKATLGSQKFQNQWLLSLHWIMLNMIVELVEERTLANRGYASLWMQSEQFIANTLLRDNLIRPNAEIASDLYDLLNGIMEVVKNRCFDDTRVSKMIPRLFWLNYFLCKLKRGYARDELIAVSNQLPILWTLTYQKILVPIIKDCELADLTYKNKKFSTRIEHVCKFFDITLLKPTKNEKLYYKKVLNHFASSSKLCESISRELNKQFGIVLSRYSARPQSDGDNVDLIAASTLIWSSSNWMKNARHIVDNLCTIQIAQSISKDPQYLDDELETLYQSALESVESQRAALDEGQDKRELDHSVRLKCASLKRRLNALDQFSPVWQVGLMHSRLMNIDTNLLDPEDYLNTLQLFIDNVNGVFISPRFYSSLVKFLQYSNKSDSNDNQIIESRRLKADMYAAYLVDLLQENIVLDHQIVGWTKLRVNTCNLPALAPLLPEYSPFITLAGSYSLDVSHLKLNSYINSSSQLDAMLVYLWRTYVYNKLDTTEIDAEYRLAHNLHHLRMEASSSCLEQPHDCNNINCNCLDQYIKSRLPDYEDLIKNLSHEDEDITVAIRLIYFGYLDCLEYAPIFTIDPAVRAREKLEIYNSELAQIKIDLHVRNTLYYWRSGENFQLGDIDAEDAAEYPFSTRLLVERRLKLERSIAKLRRQHVNRPKSDDGSIYSALRKDVEIYIERFSNNIRMLINEFTSYSRESRQDKKQGKLTNLISRCRMMIKGLEKSLSQLRSEYSLYSDILANFLAGACLVQQGLRKLYFNLEKRLQTSLLGLTMSFQDDLTKIFSFGDLNRNNIELVLNKLSFFPTIDKMCSPEEANHIQSILLKTVLSQIHYQIVTCPSDIKRCFAIVKRVADMYHKTWLQRKLYIEQKRQEAEKLYHYKTYRTTIGAEISYEQQEFLELCSRFPTYEHIYKQFVSVTTVSSDEENLLTEEKITNLNKSADLSLCNDICIIYYKLMIEASRSLLGPGSSIEISNNASQIDLDSIVEQEAEILYSIGRHCISALDKKFDKLGIEYHMFLNHKMIKILRDEKLNNVETVSLKKSIEILDEKVFNIYHDPQPHEAIRLQEFIHQVESKINVLQSKMEKNYSNHPTLVSTLKLFDRISSFLITDPMMKFITGSHSILQKLEEWNYLAIEKEDKFIEHSEILLEMINSWRKIELNSWKNSLHSIKKKYIDSTLCDLWFQLYGAFRDPVRCSCEMWSQTEYRMFPIMPEDAKLFYTGFAMFIKHFLEDSTLGDHQLRLDLVYSFIIQTRFDTIHRQDRSKDLESDDQELTIDYERLTINAYNIYMEYKSLFARVDEVLQQEEKEFANILKNEIRIVNWQRRNLWEMKNNFRISHRKLNRVMTKYLQVLRRPIPNLGPRRNELITAPSLGENPGSETLGITLSSISFLIQSVNLPTNSTTDSIWSSSLSKIVQKSKKLNQDVFNRISSKYTDNLADVEAALSSSLNDMRNFYNQRVQDVTIQPNDTKDDRREKLKLCRQMHHCKKFAVQNIFKTLRSLGMSHQRGNNIEDNLDSKILSVEPTRGLIYNKSRSAMESASSLVDVRLINGCNEKYQRTIAHNMSLRGLPKHDDLTTDQYVRIRGYALDMVIDVINQNKGAAKMYRYLLDIQAATNRISQLGANTRQKPSLICNYSDMHRALRNFSELVAHACFVLYRIKQFKGSCSLASDLQSNIENDTELSNVNYKKECSAISSMISGFDESQSMMTREQIDKINSNIDNVIKSVEAVNHQINDMLYNEITNHLYGEDEIRLLNGLFVNFISSLEQMIDAENEIPNQQDGTLLGSILHLKRTAQDRLLPEISRLNSCADYRDKECVKIDNHPNIQRLDNRLRKLVRKVKLAIQNIHKFELEPVSNKIKPYNIVDVTSIEVTLCLEQIHTAISNIMVTLNYKQGFTDVGNIVDNLSPLLKIYVQQVTAYLNIIFGSINAKLDNTIHIIPFFTEIMANGFGLPNKLEMDDSGQSKIGNTSDDNAGFGEGQGQTDVTKKLESESQLDELKNDSNEKTHNPEDKNPEAHDDGVEMSEDFGGDAQGAEDKPNDKADDDDDDIPDPSDSEMGDENQELDKEMGKVDEDESEHLDEKIWSDSDDEQDLDEARSSFQKEMSELQAKDDTLVEAQPPDIEMAPQQQDVPPTSPNASTEQPPPALPESVTDEQPINENDGNDTTTEVENDELKLDHEDISDDEQRDEDEASPGPGPSDEMELETLSSTDDVVDDMDISVADKAVDCEPMSEGECSNSPEDSSKANQEAIDDDDQAIDDDHIDKQLETEIEFPVNKDPLSDTLDNFINDSSQRGDMNPGDEGQGTKGGEVTGAVTVFNEEPGDPLEDGLSDAEDDDGPDNVQQDCSDNRVAKNVPNTSKPTDVDVMDVTQKTEEDTTKDESNIDQVKLDSERRPSKRTPIQPSNDDLRAKRRKISEPAKDKQPETPRRQLRNRPLRHLDTDDKEAPQVVDLTNDDETRVDTRDDNQADANTEIQQPPIDDRAKDLQLTKEKQPEKSTEDLSRLWYTCLQNCRQLIYELCQQLQIVLQPTKMSRYKGDYKTGKRLNMRKIISYVASNYRKDKIWLRRTKPSKRTYSICLAVDNSSSMSENNCRQMTFESLALLAKSLSIIEAGSLSVVSFGENVNCIHPFDQHYHDSIGSKWLGELRFNETKTSYRQLLEYACESFALQEQATNAGNHNPVSRLLIIISDGRNISHEEAEVKQLIRELKSAHVVTFFVVIDDLKRNGGKSIIDVKRSSGSGPNLAMFNYMELFPFPYYVLLRKIETMPSILGEALRQWFELVGHK